MTLIEQIKAAQCNEHEMLLLLKKFYPLISKYAKYLHDEDGFSELQLDFIELIHKIDINKFSCKEDKIILAYIKKTIYHCYIHHSRRLCAYQAHNVVESSLSTDNDNIFDKYVEYNDDYSFMTWDNIKDVLTDKEYTILTRLYVRCENGESIAKDLNITRQAVYQLKKRAIKKLKKSL